MRYVSDYEEFRQSDARDREMRADLRRDRAEEMGHPYPVKPVTLSPREADAAICAYCGEDRRRCECWS